jgi:hypothetical protein
VIRAFIAASLLLIARNRVVWRERRA